MSTINANMSARESLKGPLSWQVGRFLISACRSVKASSVFSKARLHTSLHNTARSCRVNTQLRPTGATPLCHHIELARRLRRILVGRVLSNMSALYTLQRELGSASILKCLKGRTMVLFVASGISSVHLSMVFL